LLFFERLFGCVFANQDPPNRTGGTFVVATAWLWLRLGLKPLARLLGVSLWLFRIGDQIGYRTFVLVKKKPNDTRNPSAKGTEGKNLVAWRLR
jgi:hypothetical protein